MREERLLALAIPSRVGVATCFPAHRPFVNRLQGAWLLHIVSMVTRSADHDSKVRLKSHRHVRKKATLPHNLTCLL
jgi:hypothetical protein